jgi:hypothetical protein
MIEASTNKKTLDFRGFPVDLNIHLESKLNIFTTHEYNLLCTQAHTSILGFSQMKRRFFYLY